MRDATATAPQPNTPGDSARDSHNPQQSETTSASNAAAAIRRTLQWAAWIAIVVLYLGTIAAWLCPAEWVQEGRVWAAVALAAFLCRVGIWHFGLGLSVAVVGLLLLRQWRMGLTLTPLLVFAIGPELATYLDKSPIPPSGATVRVVSLNLLASNHNADAVLAEVRALEPDVLVLQEYTPRWQAALSPALRDRLPHQYHAPRSDCFGTAIYAKTPLAAPMDTNLQLGTRPEFRQGRTVVQIGGQDVAMYNIHLYPPKGVDGFAEQFAALTDVLARVQQEPLPVIVCGDFNLTRRTALGAAIAAARLDDVHSLAGRGRGESWPAHARLPAWLGIRIDHVYISRDLTCVQAGVGGRVGSDHRSVWAEIGIGCTERGG